MKPVLLLQLCAFLCQPVMAQSASMDMDRRMETLVWREGAQQILRTAMDTPLTLVLAPGEYLQNVAVQSPTALQVTIAPQGDSLTIIPVSPVPEIGIILRTDQRVYNLVTRLGPPNDAIYVARFDTASASSPALMLPATAPPQTRGEPYRLGGRESIRPARVSDDGTRTYIEWHQDQSLPAIFARTDRGEEETVDSYMRGGVQVIDRVYPRLVFRSGKLVATATKASPGRKREARR